MVRVGNGLGDGRVVWPPSTRGREASGCMSACCDCGRHHCPCHILALRSLGSHVEDLRASAVLHSKWFEDGAGYQRRAGPATEGKGCGQEM